MLSRREIYRRYEAKRPPRSKAYKLRKAETQRKNVARNLLAQARYRAKTLGLEFDLAIEDVVVPTTCPYFGTTIAVAVGTRGPRYASPSLDRIDNSRGYVKGNVEVISYRANALKSNLTLAEMNSVARAMLERAL